MHLGEVARHSPTKTAVVLEERRISYAALDAASRRIARLARDHGLTRGSVLAVIAPNGPEFLAAVTAAQRSGLYALPLSTHITSEDLHYILNDSGATLLFLGQELSGLVDAAQLRQAGCTAICFEEITRLFTVENAPGETDPVEGGDMLYTSGTTGKPKGVRKPLSYSVLGSDGGRSERLRSLFAFDTDSVFLSPAPLYHAAPLRFATTLLRIGATIVLMHKFSAPEALQLLGREKVTHSQWVPTMFRRLLDCEPAQKEALVAPLHRCAIHAGAPCPVGLKREMIAWWGPILHEYYSGTESIGFTHITSEEWLQKPGSVGRPWGCAVHILGDSGERLGPKQTGTVYFSGRGSLSYHNDPEKSEQATSREGWATMGDIGYVDHAGYLYLTDRLAFTIISGGVNIYPREVEAALYEYRKVKEAAVFGVDDSDLGEAVVAVIELALDSDPTLTTAQAIRDFLDERLARFKKPRWIAFQTALPLTDSGKIHKARVRDHWREEALVVFDHAALSGAKACTTA